MLRRERKEVVTHADAVRCILDMLEPSNRQAGLTVHFEAVGHRVVHGGEQFHTPVIIDDEVLAAIDRLGELAPLHKPGCSVGVAGART